MYQQCCTVLDFKDDSLLNVSDNASGELDLV